MSSNPYESPKSVQNSPLESGRRRDLGWLLFSFQGRIPRRLYWAATIGATLVIAGAIVIMSMLPGGLDAVPIPVLMLEIILIWITFAVEVKRWHDRDKSGRWILLRFIPLTGLIWILVEAGCLRGTHGPNRYGPDPT